MRRPSSSVRMLTDGATRRLLKSSRLDFLDSEKLLSYASGQSIFGKNIPGKAPPQKSRSCFNFLDSVAGKTFQLFRTAVLHGACSVMSSHQNRSAWKIRLKAVSHTAHFDLKKKEKRFALLGTLMGQINTY